jgi:hypothetical protein
MVMPEVVPPPALHVLKVKINGAVTAFEQYELPPVRPDVAFGVYTTSQYAIEPVDRNTIIAISVLPMFRQFPLLNKIIILTIEIALGNADMQHEAILGKHINCNFN